MSADLFSSLHDAASAAARNLGLVTDPQKLAPEHWQRVLATVEAGARMRGTPLPFGWRDALAEQIGRTGFDAHDGLRS